LRKWGSFFKEGRTNVHDEERSGNLPVFTDNLKGNVEFKRSGSEALNFFFERKIGVQPFGIRGV